MPGNSTRNRIQIFAFFIGVFLLCVLLYVGGVAAIVVTAAILAYILNPVVTAIEVRGLSRGASTALVLLLITLGAILFWYTVIPIAIEQWRSMQSGSATTATSIAIARLESTLRENFGFLGLGNVNVTEEFQKLKGGFVERIPNFLMEESISLLLGLVMTPFVMFFILKDGLSFKKYFISLVPNRYFEFTMDLMYKMGVQLGNYLRGQILDALVFGALATLALWILGVPYFVFIGIFAGLANLIPFVGPIVGAFAGLIAVVLEKGDIVRGAYVLFAFGILKIVDDLIVQPWAVGKSVQLHPMVVAIAIVVGGHLFGVLGMLLAVPIAGFLKVVLEESIETYRRYRFD